MANPLDNMGWEERFMCAVDALLRMETKYQDALQAADDLRAFYFAVLSEPRKVRMVDLEAKRQKKMEYDRRSQERKRLRRRGKVVANG